MHTPLQYFHSVFQAHLTEQPKVFVSETSTTLPASTASIAALRSSALPVPGFSVLSSVPTMARLFVGIHKTTFSNEFRMHSQTNFGCTLKTTFSNRIVPPSHRILRAPLQPTFSFRLDGRAYDRASLRPGGIGFERVIRADDHREWDSGVPVGPVTSGSAAPLS